MNFIVPEQLHGVIIGFSGSSSSRQIRQTALPPSRDLSDNDYELSGVLSLALKSSNPS
jgi:hypothetical protein